MRAFPPSAVESKAGSYRVRARASCRERVRKMRCQYRAGSVRVDVGAVQRRHASVSAAAGPGSRRECDRARGPERRCVAAPAVVMLGMKKRNCCRARSVLGVLNQNLVDAIL